MRHAAQPGEAACGDISRLLSAWKNGDRRALEKLTPMVYAELRQLARRAHFFAVSAQPMPGRRDR